MRIATAVAGFSPDASVRIEPTDRASLERLIRYCARRPFALDGLDQSPEFDPAHPEPIPEHDFDQS